MATDSIAWQDPTATAVGRPVAPGMHRARHTEGAELREFTRFDKRPGKRKPAKAATPLTPARPLSWEATAVDITRLDKRDADKRRQINNAWRTVKAESADGGQRLAETFAALRERFPSAGIEVPSDTLGPAS